MYTMQCVPAQSPSRAFEHRGELDDRLFMNRTRERERELNEEN